MVFQPNIVIDAKLGCLWHIKLCLSELLHQMPDLGLCTQLALKRTCAKQILLKLLLESITQPKPPLEKLKESFDHINSVYRKWAEAEIQMQMASPSGASPPARPTNQTRVLIDQLDIYTNILQKLEAEGSLRKLEWVLVSYITSLSEHNIPVQHSINELTITTYVRNGKFTALQQLLQYGVVSDSKPLACLLLSLANLYPTASQLALDMLARLGADDEIEEILLSQGDVISALKVSQENANPRKYLHTAQNTGDAALFHSTFHHFKSKPQHTAALRKGK